MNTLWCIFHPLIQSNLIDNAFVLKRHFFLVLLHSIIFSFVNHKRTVYGYILPFAKLCNMYITSTICYHLLRYICTKLNLYILLQWDYQTPQLTVYCPGFFFHTSQDELVLCIISAWNDIFANNKTTTYDVKKTIQKTCHDLR